MLLPEFSAASFAATHLCRGSSQQETVGARGALKSCGCSSGQAYTPRKEAGHTHRSSGPCLDADACATLMEGTALVWPLSWQADSSAAEGAYAWGELPEACLSWEGWCTAQLPAFLCS